MTNPSKRLQHRILHFKYCRATEYDLDGDRLDTDEFIYDSDVSVEDKVQPSPLAMSLRKQYIKYDNKGQVTRDKEPAQRGGSVDSSGFIQSLSLTSSNKFEAAAKDLPSRPPPRLSALKQPIVNMSDNSSGAPSDTNVGIVPDPSGEYSVFRPQLISTAIISDRPEN